MNRTGPRERLAALGGEALADAELVAVLLGTGARGMNVLALSSHLLELLGGLEGVISARVVDLAAIPGIGNTKAARLVAAIELGRRALTRPLTRGPGLISSRDVDAALRPRLGRAEREHFVAIPLDARNRPIGEISLAVGGLSACPVLPADVFRPLLRCAASAVIFVHNHPSGSPEPSQEDIELTHRLRDVGDMLGVRVLDHVILAHEGYFSFLDHHMMREDA